MKKNISFLKIFAIATVLVIGLNYAHAAWVSPTGTAPTNNIAIPIHTGTDQIKDDALTLNTLLVTQNAQFDQDLFLKGTVKGAGGNPSLVSFGGIEPVTNQDVLVSIRASGDLKATQHLTSTLLANDFTGRVCADESGALVLCSTSTIVPVGGE